MHWSSRHSHWAQSAKMLAGLLEQLMEPAGIYELSDVYVRAKEGLAASAGLLWAARHLKTSRLMRMGGASS